MRIRYDMKKSPKITYTAGESSPEVERRAVAGFTSPQIRFNSAASKDPYMPVTDRTFNKSMAHVARTNVKVRKAMARAAAAVMASIEAEAARHHYTGNYIRHLTLEAYGKAAGWQIVAHDDEAAYIEFGHFMAQDIDGVANEDNKTADTRKHSDAKAVTGARQAPSDATSDGAGTKIRDGQIWVEGTHIMREGARRAAGHVGTPKKGRLTLK